MGWLRRARAVDSTALGEGLEIADGDANPALHDSPALSEIFATLDPEQPVRVLDLGPALQTNLNFYATIADGVRIVPLLRKDGLSGLQELDPEAFTARLNRLLPVDEQVFGLVLMWDLLNYLVGEQPSLLARHLVAITERGAKIHAMIVNAPTMPSEPSRYELHEDGRLTYRPTTTQETPAPDTPPALVERWLKPFRIERSFLLRHGVREFIAIRG